MKNSIYYEWIKIENPNDSLYERIKILMDSHNLQSVSWGTDHKSVMVSLFGNWSMEHPIMEFSNLEKAYDAFFEIYKNNQSYFSK